MDNDLIKSITDLSAVIEKNRTTTETFQKEIERQIEVAKSEYSSMKEELNEIKAAQGRMKAAQDTPTFGGARKEMNEAIAGMKEGIEALATGKQKSVMAPLGGDFISKAVADMTIAGHLTGDPAVQYASGIVGVPYRTPHARQLLSFIPSSVDTYNWFQHTGGEGAIDWQSAEGAEKAQFDEDFTEKSVALRYLAGYMIVTRQMLRNVPSLQAYLNQWLPQKYMRAEDSKFYTFLTGESGLTTFPTTGANIERLIVAMGSVGGLGFSPNGIAINPASWARIVLTKTGGGEYTLPPGIVIAPNGDLTLFGTPIYMTSWVADDKAIVADWTYGGLVQSEGMSLRISEEHGTILTQNKVLALIEASIAFALQNPLAFTTGDLGDVA